MANCFDHTRWEFLGAELLKFPSVWMDLQCSSKGITVEAPPCKRWRTGCFTDCYWQARSFARLFPAPGTTGELTRRDWLLSLPPRPPSSLLVPSFWALISLWTDAGSGPQHWVWTEMTSVHRHCWLINRQALGGQCALFLGMTIYVRQIYRFLKKKKVGIRKTEGGVGRWRGKGKEPSF